MDRDVPEQTDDWKKTKEAAANFRRLLLCSKCSELMKEPVCLGVCEHMVCRSCAGPRAGDGCVVCRSPAWVKDIQINRQLSSIIQLYCNLDSLLNPADRPDSVAENQTQPGSPVLKHRKNFKIWFSPRSRKVRCTVEKPSEVSVPDSGLCGEAAAAQRDAITAQHQDLSVFNFASSSQDSGSSSQTCDNGSGQRKKGSTRKNGASRKALVQRAGRKQSKQTVKKKKLEAINKQWGITAEVGTLKEQEQPHAEGARRSSKKVSFHSPAVMADQPQAEVPHGSMTDLSVGRSPTRESLSGGSTTEMIHQVSEDLSMSDCVIQQNTPTANDNNPDNTPEKQDKVSPPKNSSKRTRADTVETTPKRPRVSPARRRKSQGQLSPVVLNPSFLTSPWSSPLSVGKSPTALGRVSPGSPAIMKKNHKGETPLHLSAIKGDAEAVKALLDQGADPNLKDNAGWTPLHEACNLGHMAVVEALISKGALLNTPGYENDSPLHDAVRNGHPAIVKRLLQLGALQNVLNLHGKRPADYAVGAEMLEIFQEAADGTQFGNTSFSPSASCAAVSECATREELVVCLPSKLPPPAQLQLAKLGELLGGRLAETFSGSVSHVVVPEGHMPTTYSTLLGLLAGCWVVRYSWVEASLQAGKWMPETEHEAGEGPQRSRLNRCSLLPPLFDGCFFFLLGSFKAPTKDRLTKLLREGGGQLLSRQPKPDSDVTQTLSAAAYHALPGSDQALCTQYIIFDPQGPHKPTVVRRGKVWSAPSTWIINCIAAFQLLPVPDPQV